MHRIEKLYIDKPVLWWVYAWQDWDWILIDDIPNSIDFYCHAIKLDYNWKPIIHNKIAEIKLLNILIK